MSKHIFVSGCYDPLHAGHIQFFRDARALGGILTVCFASADVLWAHKRRRPLLPDDHKAELLRSLKMVDHVVVGDSPTIGLDFEKHFTSLRPDILAVTEDDKYAEAKQRLCAAMEAEYRVLPKSPPLFAPVSSTDLIQRITTPAQVPLRVDFAGGWRDVPRNAKDGSFIINCTIAPMVSLNSWPYQKGGGLGGSAAYAILQGRNGVASELDLGVGWQDPAVIHETGLCVWRSGQIPVLHVKRNPDMLCGLMALLWTGQSHNTPDHTDTMRDYALIDYAGKAAAHAAEQGWLPGLLQGVKWSYQAQQKEGMNPLPNLPNAVAYKYCGGGWGGYALYIYPTQELRNASGLIPIEPYLRQLP